MCLAMPGKIIEIKDNQATIEYLGEKRTAAIISGNYGVGDYVFVSSNIIVQKIPEQEALQSLEAIKDAA